MTAIRASIVGPLRDTNNSACIALPIRKVSFLFRQAGDVVGAQVSGTGGAAGAPPYPSPNSLSVSLEISAGSSIPNRPIAMIFSATSCVRGSSRSFRRSAPQRLFVSRHQTLNVLRLEGSVSYQLVDSHAYQRARREEARTTFGAR